MRRDSFSPGNDDASGSIGFGYREYVFAITPSAETAEAVPSTIFAEIIRSTASPLESIGAAPIIAPHPRYRPGIVPAPVLVVDLPRGVNACPPVLVSWLPWFFHPSQCPKVQMEE